VISLTEKAANKIITQIEKRQKGLGIRVGVKTTGCSGLAYTLEFVDNPNNEDLIFESNGAKIFIDPKSLAYMDETIIDYERKGLNEGFAFTNPKEKDKCGCGESFRV
jgi:iron-sulfur cluster assembly protein